MNQVGQIILIDDNPVELLLCKQALKNIECQHEIISFSNPKVAFDYLKKTNHKIFIVICDIEMPQMTGIELLEKINANGKLRLKAIPFIFLSNSNVDKEIERAYALAAQGYFLKSYSLDGLCTIFKRIIDYWDT